jgi:hypothetical protein
LLRSEDADEEEFEVIDRASCCWRCARLSVFLVLLGINNFITCLCGAYLARSAWFDDWFNGSGLSALSAKLAVTVPRCAADALGYVNGTNATAVAAGLNGTNASMLVLAPPLPPGTLFASDRGRVCGFF